MINDFLHDKLIQIGNSMDTGKFVNVEDELLELKDVSSGLGTSLKQSVCAFLNTNGGYLICGIREHDNKEYRVTGFDKNKENELIDLQTKVFKTEEGIFLDLSEHIALSYHDFRGKHLAIIHIRPVSEDVKYLTYFGKAYERVLTQDREISKTKILEHQEYKQELEYSKELSIVEGATIEELDFEKIKEYIARINERGLRTETLKKTLEEAKPFLIRRNCLKDDQVTTLGLLLFGKDPEYYLGNRTEVDCFLTNETGIAEDKKDFQSDVLTLMTESFRFIWKYIKVARTTKNGGSSEPEYPENLIRESINNALAHRDYTIDQFTTIRVRPNLHLQIKNPGSFKSKMLIVDKGQDVQVLRIIPGIPESKNPKLAAILKTYDRVENQGIGMSTLVGVCLNNTIDVPYYEIEPLSHTLSLFIPSGRLLDKKIEYWLKSFDNYLSEKLEGNYKEEHKRVLAYFYKSEKLNKAGKYTVLLSKSNNHFEVIDALLEANLIYKHPASKEEAPVYVLERDLMHDNFNGVLSELLQSHFQAKNTEGVVFSQLDAIEKQVLNIIYRNSRFNRQAIKPSDITPEVYLLEYGESINPKTYQSLGRKVRNICKNYFEIGFLEQNSTSKGYQIPPSV
jgi:predicted HTH transcriptional regulator